MIKVTPKASYVLMQNNNRVIFFISIKSITTYVSTNVHSKVVV